MSTSSTSPNVSEIIAELRTHAPRGGAFVATRLMRVDSSVWPEIEAELTRQIPERPSRAYAGNQLSRLVAYLLVPTGK